MRRWATMASVAVGCSSAPIVADLPLEPDDRGIVLVVTLGDARRYFGVDRGAPAALPAFEASDARPLVVHAIAYDEPLSRLGFATGEELFEAAAESAGSRALGPWARVARRELGLTSDTGWQPDDGASLGAVRLGAERACRGYAARSLALTSTLGIAAAYPDDEDHLMLALAGDPSPWLRLDREASAPVDAPIPGLMATAAERSPGGVVYVAGLRAGRTEIWARRDGSFAPLPAPPGADEGERIAWMSATAVALFVESTRGRVARHDGAWTELAGPTGIARNFGGLAATADGGVTFLEPFSYADGERVVRRGDGGRVVLRGLLPYSLAEVPGLGVVIGANDGRLHRLEGSELRPLFSDETVDGRIIQALLPVRAGVWSGVIGVGITGVALEGYEDGELCRGVGTSIDAVRALPLGDDVVALGQLFPTEAQRRSGERTPGATLLIRGAPPPR